MPKRTIALAVAGIVLASSILYITYGLERYQTVPMLTVYTVACVAYWYLCSRPHGQRWFVWLMGGAVLLRLLLIPAMPNLSDDVYRFIWDGRLLVQGENPFAYLPSQIMERQLYRDLRGIDEYLFSLLNSPAYFTIYPPVNQAIFASAAWLFPDSVYHSILLIRLWLFLAELGSMFLFYKLLSLMKLPTDRLLLYALNPLVVLELTANLHFEALVVCMLLLSFYLLHREKLVLSSLCFALAVSTKLLPLILLPLYWRRLGTKKACQFYLLTACFTLLTFLPLLNSELIQGMSQSVGLYFQKFEFNASVYYLVREMGYIMKGYNIIASAGLWMAVSAFVAIILYVFVEREASLPVASMWVWLIYLAFSTTVHPWYVIPLLAFSLFSSYRFAVLWSWLVFFSYAGYTTGGFEEKLWIPLLEYTMLAAFVAYEVWQNKTGKSPFVQEN